MKKLILPLIIAGTLTACASVDNKKVSSADRIINANSMATDKLLQGSKVAVNSSAPVLVATVVDLGNLRSSTNLGKLISEQISTSLTQQGYTVLELKMKDSLSMDGNGGELILSRSAQEVAKSYKAQAVVAGTYTVSGNTAFVSVKLLNPFSSTAMSAYSYSLPLGEHGDLALSK